MIQDERCNEWHKPTGIALHVRVVVGDFLCVHSVSPWCVQRFHASLSRVSTGAAFSIAVR